ncbi:MAG: hypothetical protein IKT01_02750 [Eubacteriaceae bacterium]|nr:hypothetical protein [Eubacteriaceae bacterium]
MGLAGKWSCLTETAVGNNTSYWEIFETKDGKFVGTSDCWGEKLPFESIEFVDNKFKMELLAHMQGVPVKFVFEGEYLPEKDELYGSAASNMGSTHYKGTRIG